MRDRCRSARLFPGFRCAPSGLGTRIDIAMVALKSSEIDAFVARPCARRPIALVLGPDAGLVRERGDALVKAAVDDPADPFALARLEGDALADEPSRLVEEAHTIPLFGGRRGVWVRAGGRNFT